MQNKIKNLKQRIEDNKAKLYKEYGNNCKLVIPTLKMINLLLSANAPDDRIKHYLQSVYSSIKIIEEKLDNIENQKE